LDDFTGELKSGETEEFTLFADLAELKSFDASFCEKLNGLPLDKVDRKELMSNLAENGVYTANALASVDVETIMPAVKNETQSDYDRTRNLLSVLVDESADGQFEEEEEEGPDPAELMAAAKDTVTELNAKIKEGLAGGTEAIEAKTGAMMEAVKGSLDSLELETEALQNAAVGKGRDAVSAAGGGASGASVFGQKYRSSKLITRLGLLHGITLSPFADEPISTGKVVTLKPLYLDEAAGSDALYDKVFIHSPQKTYESTFETADSYEMQLVTKTVSSFGLSAMSSAEFQMSVGGNYAGFSGSSSYGFEKDEKTSQEREEENTQRMRVQSHEYFKTKMSFEPRILTLLDEKMLQPTPEFMEMVRMAGATQDLDALAFRLSTKFGTHVCPHVTLGGVWSIRSRYRSNSTRSGYDMSQCAAKAIEKTESHSFGAEAGGSGLLWSVSASSTGAGGSTENSKSASGKRSVSNEAMDGDELTVEEEWMGGTSGAGVSSWRNSLDEGTNSNWRVIDRQVQECIGNWNWLPLEEEWASKLKKAMISVWLIDQIKMSKDLADVVTDQLATSDVRATQFAFRCGAWLPNGCPAGWGTKDDFDRVMCVGEELCKWKCCNAPDGVTQPTPAPAPAPEVGFQLDVNFVLQHKSGKCVHPTNSDKAIGNNNLPLIHGGCSPGAISMRAVPPSDGGEGFLLKNANSRKYLFPKSQQLRAAAGTPVVYHGANNVGAAIWRHTAIPAGDGYFMIKHMGSGHCIAPRDDKSSPPSGTPLKYKPGCGGQDFLLFKQIV